MYIYLLHASAYIRSTTFMYPVGVLIFGKNYFTTKKKSQIFAPFLEFLFCFFKLL